MVSRLRQEGAMKAKSSDVVEALDQVADAMDGVVMLSAESRDEEHQRRRALNSVSAILTLALDRLRSVIQEVHDGGLS
jgi:hypothetical protein